MLGFIIILIVICYALSHILNIWLKGYNRSLIKYEKRLGVVNVELYLPNIISELKNKKKIIDDAHFYLNEDLICGGSTEMRLKDNQWSVLFCFNSNVLPKCIVDHEIGHGVYFGRRILSGKTPFIGKTNNEFLRLLFTCAGLEYYYEYMAWRNTGYRNSRIAQRFLNTYLIRWAMALVAMFRGLLCFLVVAIVIWRIFA